MVFLYYYFSNLSLNRESGGIYRYFLSNKSISKIIDLVRPVDVLSEIAFSIRQNAVNEHCETLKKLVQNLNLHH